MCLTDYCPGMAVAAQSGRKLVCVYRLSVSSDAAPAYRDCTCINYADSSVSFDACDLVALNTYDEADMRSG